MRSIPGDIDSGGFAAALQDEFRNGYPCRPFLNAVVGGDDDLISCTERDYRKMARCDGTSEVVSRPMSGS